MVPVCRTEGDIFAIPQLALAPGDIDGFLHELEGFHTAFRACFARSEPREHFFRYMVGQLSDLERKSIEPIALRVEGGKVRAMQRCLSEVAWDEARMVQTYHGLVRDDLGEPDGVVIFDETGFPKKGKDSVGVARQYCPGLGIVTNCQVGVFAAYASRQGYALVDTRLFLPEAWFTEAYAARRPKCQVPEVVTFQTKPQLAATMVRALEQEGLLPFKYVVADGLYGQSPTFLEAVEACRGKTYFVAVPADTRCWVQAPVTAHKRYRYKGETRVKRVVAPTATPPVTVERLAHGVQDCFWYQRTVSEGTKGPMAYEFTRRLVTLSKEGLPQKTVWLVIKRTLGEPHHYWYSISNAPASTPFRVFVWLSGVRWAIEQCFEETKTELGMDQYEVRKYSGWYHHIMTCMLAHFFLWHLKIRLGKKSTSAYCVAA
jgi:SRSO17 transposase